MSGYKEFTKAAIVYPGCLDNLEPDPFWGTGDSRELKRHRIHAYPAKFPAFITTKALAHARHQKRSVGLIADIFCGCGTVAFEARREGIDFWGCDINPVATLIAKTKSGVFAEHRLEQYFQAIAVAYKSAPSDIALDPVAQKRLDYWFSAGNKERLARLLNAIHASVPTSSPYRLFFHCAFSNMLKGTSRWLTKSIKPQVDPNKVPADPWVAFKAQFEMMKTAFSESPCENASAVKVVTGNFLRRRTLPTNVDLLVTSPPYVTSYEYADLHQLSSLWLGYADDYRLLRKGSIGSSQHTLNFDKEVEKLNKTGTRIVQDLSSVDHSLAKAAANYFLDMQQVATKCHPMLSDAGLAVFIIGNTAYKGIRLDNAAHFAESLLLGGFSRVQIAKRRMSGKILTPYRDTRGKFSKSGEGRHVYGEEFVVIAIK